MEDISPFPSAMSMELDDGTIVEFPEQTVRALSHIAVRNEIGYGAALAQVIADEKFLLDAEAQGGKLLMHQADGRLRELVRR